MPWWLIWVVLIVVALALLAWLGLRLYRSFRALTAEVGRAQGVLEGLQSRLEELEALGESAAALTPQIVLDDAGRADLRASRAEVKRVRRSRRRARHDRAAERWDAITGERRP